jgi:hypothetical protein
MTISECANLYQTNSVRTRPYFTNLTGADLDGMTCPNGRYARSGRVASGRSQTTVARRQRGMSRRLRNLGLCRFRVVRAHQGLIVQQDGCVPQLGLCIDAPRPIQSASRRRGRAFAAASPASASRRAISTASISSAGGGAACGQQERLTWNACRRSTAPRRTYAADLSIPSHKQIGRSMKRQIATWQERQELVF